MQWTWCLLLIQRSTSEQGSWMANQPLSHKALSQQACVLL